MVIQAETVCINKPLSFDSDPALRISQSYIYAQYSRGPSGQGYGQMSFYV